jgi:hypothetical protein
LPPGFEQRAYLRDIGVDQFETGTRRPVTPEHVHDLLAGDDLAVLDRK